MRIAISGTHCAGKSTLIEEFVLAFPEYVDEPEAYEALEDVFPEPTSESFFEQLEYHVDRLKQYNPGDCVIFERSPLDYVAYLEALIVLGRSSSDSYLANQSISIAREALRLLDLIVFLRGDEIATIGDDEDPELRDFVDTRLEEILINDSLNMFGAASPKIVRASGDVAQRLEILNSNLNANTKETFG